MPLDPPLNVTRLRRALSVPSPESVARWNPRSEVKDACSDDCATEVPYNSEDAHLNILNKETSQDHDLKITKVSISIILRLFIICV
jgi:hypothetical protein